MNYIKTTINKVDYKKVQPFMGKYLCEFCPIENDDETISVIQSVVKELPTDDDFEQMNADAEAYFLPMEKESKIASIVEYDKSDNVNSFTFNGQPMWIPLEERKNMRQSLLTLKSKGIETFTYWYGLVPITMTVDQFSNLMDDIELYALMCFNVTSQHKFNVMSLDRIEDVLSYDFTEGYPEKLVI